MKKWIRAARAFAIAGSTLPAILGSVFAYYEKGNLNILLMILTVIGVASIHLGANFINDYFDHLSGADEKNTEGVFPFSGGSRFIQDGIIPPKHILAASILCFSVGMIIGTVLFFVSGYWVLVLAAIGILSCIFYVSPRFSLTNIGLGEVIVGFNLGFLVIMGSYYVQTSGFSFGSFLLAIPIALTTTLILYINEFPDYKGDLLAGKRNAIVRLGRKKASHLLVVLLSLIVASILFNVILGFMPVWTLISLLSLPLFINGVLWGLRYYDDIPNFIPCIISVLNVNVFVNVLLTVSLFAANGDWLVFIVLLVCTLVYEIKVLSDIYKFKDSQFSKDLTARFNPPSAASKNINEGL